MELKDVKGYEGFYKVDDCGNVYSLKRATTKGGVISPQKTHNGYYRVGLSKNGKLKHHFVHRIVADAFIPNPYNLSQINHKDENKTNNGVDNLEWCEQLYNVRYGTGIKRQVLKRTGVKHSEERKTKISQTLKGRKPPVLTEEGRLKCKIAAQERWNREKEKKVLSND